MNLQKKRNLIEIIVIDGAILISESQLNTDARNERQTLTSAFVTRDYENEAIKTVVNPVWFIIDNSRTVGNKLSMPGFCSCKGDFTSCF